jgi:hypothetical protein
VGHLLLECDRGRAKYLDLTLIGNLQRDWAVAKVDTSSLLPKLRSSLGTTAFFLHARVSLVYFDRLTI